MQSHKSLSYIDTLDDGSIYIQAGNTETPITNIGKNTSGSYRPYVEKESDLNILYSYKFLGDYIPANFKSLAEFIYAFEQQSVSNEYIHNYINLASEQMFDFLNSNGVVDEKTIFASVNNSNVTFEMLKYMTSQVPDQAIDDLVILKEDFDEGELSIADSAPKEVREKLEGLLYQVDRVDRSFTFEDLNLEPKYLKYINGFVEINEKKLKSIDKGNSIVLVSDFFSKRSAVMEAYRLLEKRGYSILFAIVLAKKQ